MEEERFPIQTPKQLKNWINNVAKKNGLVANMVLQNFMMERLLERIAVSRYRDNFILKGGFLIAAMVGIDMRSTMDMDTTIKGLPVSKEKIEAIVSEILAIDISDHVTFHIKSMKPVHNEGSYEDFRIGIEGTFFTIRVNMKLDITTGDTIIPSEMEYSFKLMFEDRSIQIKAYNLNTILAEKVESILVRNVSNTRARDFYDVYILLTTRTGDIVPDELYDVILRKAEERHTTEYVRNYKKYIEDIRESKDLSDIWSSYQLKYTYAADIAFEDIVNSVERIFLIR